MKKSFGKGFTLVELLVVMAILGILATIGLGSFYSSQMKARDAQRKHDLGQIQKALEMYCNDYGHYPPVADFPDEGTSWVDASGTLYMREMPGDPGDTDYCYATNSGGSWYKLYAKLENEKDRDCLVEDCSLVRSCGSESYNYGVSSSNESP